MRNTIRNKETTQVNPKKTIFFFIEETKGTMEALNLKTIEQAKIKCAKKHFADLSTEDVVYHDIDSYQSLLNIMESL